MSGGRKTDAKFRRAIESIVGKDREQQGEISCETVIEIAAILLTQHGISANAVDALVCARRSDVLSVVRAIRSRVNLVPEPGNRQPESTSGPVEKPESSVGKDGS